MPLPSAQPELHRPPPLPGTIDRCLAAPSQQAQSAAWPAFSPDYTLLVPSLLTSQPVMSGTRVYWHAAANLTAGCQIPIVTERTQLTTRWS